MQEERGEDSDAGLVDEHQARGIDNLAAGYEPPERLLDRPTVSPMAPFGASGGAEGGASRASGRVGGSESDTRLAGERDTMRDEMTRLMHSASQPKTDLRHAFYVDPQQQMSKHHLHSEDLDSHHRAGDFPHAWQPLSTTGHGGGKRRDSKSHHKLKLAGLREADDDKGAVMRDVLSAPQLTQQPEESGGDKVTADTLDSGGGGAAAASPDGVGFYIGEAPRAGGRAVSVEPVPSPSEQRVKFHLGDLGGETSTDAEGKESPRAQPDADAVSEMASLPPQRQHRHQRHHHHHRRRHHMRIPVGDELENRRHLGSAVELDESMLQQPATEQDEASHLGDADLDDMKSHRFSDSRGLRRRISHFHAESLVGFAGAKDKDVEVDHSPHELFVELQELSVTDAGEFEWREKARWIKFEEDVEEDTERWGRPHVASLSFHSLLELRHCIEQGAVVLDLDADNMLHIACNIVDKLIVADQLDIECRPQVLQCLLSKHKHVGQKDESMRRNSSYFNLHGLDRKSSVALSARQPMQRRTTSPHHEIATTIADGKDGIEKGRAAMKRGSLAVGRSKGEKVTFTNDVLVHMDSDSEKKIKLNDMVPSTSTSSSPPLSVSSTPSRHDTNILRRIPVGAESMAVLVGAVDFLDREVTAFIRLSSGRHLDNVIEVPLPVRFIFILLGPPSAPIHYHEVGRSIATLMANKYFHFIAYKAENRDDLLFAINEFLDDSLVLPPGDWDRRTLLPVMEAARKKRIEVQQKHDEQTKLVTPEVPAPVDVYGDPLQRTKRLFGGLLNDVKRRYPWYLSDFRDGLNVQCLATFFFIYFACLSPAITFGGLLGEKTDQLIGVSEMLVMTSVGGIVFALFSAQPISIVGCTGPLLVFEESLFRICADLGLEYLAMRFWVYIWVTVIFFFLVMLEGSFLVRYITRFTEEVFSSLISVIFIYEVFFKLYKIFEKHPLVESYGGVDGDTSGGNFSMTGGVNMTGANATAPGEDGARPNTALLSLILTFSTFLIAYFLKLFRNSSFLGRSARRALGDFGIPIAIVVMVIIDYLLKETYTEKLYVPDGLTPTAADRRGWFINPLGSSRSFPIWAIFAAFVPALLVFILIFMESQITSLIVNKKERGLRKGSGYHLDLLIVGCLASLSGVMGLPLLSCATVRSVTHVSALSVFSRTHAPGETPKLLGVLEQRVTGLAVHIMIGVSVMMGAVLRQVPLAILFGVFLYMGIVSMTGVQLFERVELLFMPMKHHPQKSYVRHVRTMKMHLYTLIQLMILALMWAVKSTDGALAFPFVLILTIPVRKHLLKYIFTEVELEHLDGDPKEMEYEESSTDEPDFYQQAHVIE